MADEERIYDRDKMNQLEVFPTKKTPSYADWRLFEMGKDLEDSVDASIADVYTKEEIDTKVGSLAKDDLSNVDFGSENVGKSLMVDSDGGIEVGNPSFTPGTSGVVVPDTPATIHDAVNQAYVESTVDGVNDLLHKTGNETKTGIFTCTKLINGLSKFKISSYQFSANTWTRIYVANENIEIKIIGQTFGGIAICDFVTGAAYAQNINRSGLVSKTTYTPFSIISILNISTEKLEVWVKSNTTANADIDLIGVVNIQDNIIPNIVFDGTTSEDEPVADDVTYKNKVVII